MGRTDLPRRQQEALRKAIFWEWFTLGYSAVTITLIALVVGGSQAMKTAWIEDILSLLPQISFLIALLVIRRRPSRRFPYGLHRAMGIGHLVAGVALLLIGALLAVESALGLLRAEHPAIGTVNLFGHTVWLGWCMVTVMIATMWGPFVYGRAKLKLAPDLHNKVLFTDADMSKADWTTTAASVVGVLGIGIGLWWLDGVAALFISLGIVKDGWTNLSSAILDLMDQRARTFDDSEPHPLIRDIVRRVRREDWVRDASVRMRDMGQVFHIEVFVVPRSEVTLEQLEATRDDIAELDWKAQDIVLIPVSVLPDESSRGNH